MKRLSMSMGAVGVAMMLIAGSIGLLRDTTLFTSPPEAVAEGFVRELVEGRYNRAEEYLSDSMASHVNVAALKELAFFILMRSGGVLEIKGLRGTIKENEAVAVAYMRTSVAGEWALNLHMVRDQGVWAIDEIGSSRQTRMQESIFGVPMPGLIAQGSSGVALSIADDA